MTTTSPATPIQVRRVKELFVEWRGRALTHEQRLRVEGAVISAAAPALPLALRVDEVRPAKP